MKKPLDHLSKTKQKKKTKSNKYSYKIYFVFVQQKLVFCFVLEKDKNH